MRHHRTRQLLSLLAVGFAVVVLAATPASADVDCADLASQPLAQSYFDGRAGDLDRLDADGDGRACEGNDPVSRGSLSLPGLAVLVLGALGVNAIVARRQARSGLADRAPVEREAVAPRVPAQRAGAPVGVVETPRVQVVVDDPPLDGLARALRRVPPARRTSLVELYAVAHHVTPQDVLDALAADGTDVGLQRWAAAVGSDLQVLPRD